LPHLVGIFHFLNVKLHTSAVVLECLCHILGQSFLVNEKYIVQVKCTLFCTLQGSADKSLAQPTSRCHRMESILSLERGVCSCAELQVSSCYRG